MSHPTARRGFRLERWRIHAWYRRYKGRGHPVFEFEFRLGGLPRSEVERREREWGEVYADV